MPDMCANGNQVDERDVNVSEGIFVFHNMSIFRAIEIKYI